MTREVIDSRGEPTTASFLNIVVTICILNIYSETLDEYSYSSSLERLFAEDRTIIQKVIDHEMLHPRYICNTTSVPNVQ